MRVALTYDDGPSRWTGPILDVLAEHGAKATFFVLGCNVTGNHPLLRRMIREDHEVGVHGWSHRRCTELADDEFLRDLELTKAAIEDACGVEPTLWRPPHHATTVQQGHLAESVGLKLGRRSYRTHRAMIDPADWARTASEDIAHAVQRQLENLSIINLHDGVPPDGGTGTRDRQPTVDATRLILEQRPDVDWVTVSEL